MSLFFINDALAATNTVTTSAQQPGGAGNMLFILIIFAAIFYFLLIRPQAKRNKAQQKMWSSLEIGDEVTTIGGIMGRIKKVDEQMITLEISPGVEIKVQKIAVSSLLPKDSLKN